MRTPTVRATVFVTTVATVAPIGCATILGDFTAFDGQDSSVVADARDDGRDAAEGGDVAAEDHESDAPIESETDASGDGSRADSTVRDGAGDATLETGIGEASDDAAPACPSSTPTQCSGTCVDPQNDSNNCGSCGNACAGGQQCVAGACQCNLTSCPMGCCNGDSCEAYASQSNGSCGNGGATCAACQTGIACNTDGGLCLGCSGPTQISETFGAAAGDSFGASVAVSGSLALVGAPSAGSGVGTAYAFTGSGSTWTLQSQLYPGAGVKAYGTALALSGTTAAVTGFAAGADAQGPPAVYVFGQIGTGWFQQTTIIPSADASIYQGALAMDGSTLVVGGSTSAAVYTESGATWGLQANLTPSDFTPSSGSGSYFGSAVAISGDTVVVAGEPSDSAGQLAHWLYVFVRSGSTWTQQGPKIVPSGLADSSAPHFNFTIGISGDTIVLATNTNGAYVYGRSGGTWTQTQLILPGSDFTFGSAVAVSGRRAIVGSASYTGGTGLMYLLGQSNATWISGPQYSDTTGFGIVSGDGYGYAVAMNGATAIVGAPGGTSLGAASAAGVAYIYSCWP
jgi:hypothetical protein